MIQDTSFIIDLLRGDEDAEKLLAVIEAESRPEKVSAVTVLELYGGLTLSSASESEREDIIDVLESKHVVAADHTVMRKAGKISGALINEGQRIDREDCIIAATGLIHDETVITRNVDHFERVDSLDVQTY